MVANERGVGAVGWRGEAQRWRVEAQRLGGENVGLRAQVGELEGQVAALKETVATLSRALYGDSSEKRTGCGPASKAERQRCSADDTAGDDAGPQQGSSGKRRRGQQRGSRGHGRRDYSHLPVEEVVHEPDPEMLVCPSCNAAYVPFGEERCEQIDWEVVVRRVVHRRPTYRRGCECSQAKGVVAAPPPSRPIPRGRFTSGFIARLVAAKFAFGLPVNRIVGMLESEGASFAPGSLCGTLKATAGLLAPAATAIRTRNASGSHLHIDETSWKVFEPLAGKANNRWWCWVFVGTDTTAFSIKPGRGASVVADHVGIDLDADTPTLGDGRDLVISSDFYTPYQRLGRDVEGVTNAWCWAHMRRYFLRAGDSDPALAQWSADWLERIAGLFTAHRAWALAAHGSDAEADGYQQLTDIIARIDTTRQAQAADGSLPAAAGKVLATLDREWDGLVSFLAHPGIPLDNNAAERGLRRPVVIRKNCYGSQAHWSAKLAADAWTILATIEQHGLNPTMWLSAYLDACAAAGGTPPPPATLAGLLPWTADAATLTAWQHTPGGPSP
jgi:transposase